MRDPFSYSFAIPGRVFGITVRVHILFPIVALGIVLRYAFDEHVKVPGAWIDAVLLVFLMFLSVLLHEFGHCFMARRVGGDASEVLLWPLGGLANVDVPHSPKANFLVAAGGPMVNLALCAGTALALLFAFEYRWWPPLNPFGWSLWQSDENNPGMIALTLWNGDIVRLPHFAAPILVAQLFWVNWLLLLLNVLVLGYPLDGGRMFQAVLWPYVGYRQATMTAVFSGFIFMILMVVASFAKQEVMLLALAIFIYVSCKQQWYILEAGGEDSLFGYDFSQGYTSLEKERQEPPRARQQNFFQRWRQRRAAKKLLREQQRQEAEETRMDQLLEKIQRSGTGSLTEEEKSFLKRVADRYRNRP